jgi:putative redox protein
VKPPVTLQLVWEHDLIFSGHAGETEITLDSAGQAGPSPVQTLAFALAGCMAMDVAHVLTRGRHDMRGLAVRLTATRAQQDPHRVLTADVEFTVTGNVPGAAVQRAIDLSRDTYCSVWHSLRQDITLTTTFTVAAGT